MRSRMQEPTLLRGDVALDDRGEVGFVNTFDFAGVKRFYTVSNHRPGFVRAWHRHRHEAKYVMAVVGAALVGAVAVDDWERPSKTAKVWRYTLSARWPAGLPGRLPHPARHRHRRARGAAQCDDGRSRGVR